MKRRNYPPGHNVTKAGELGDSMYFVTFGQCDVISEMGVTFSVATCGTYVGEVAVLKRIPRIATVRTREECTAYELKKEDMDQVLRKHPDLYQEILQVAEERLVRFRSNTIVTICSR